MSATSTFLQLLERQLVGGPIEAIDTASPRNNLVALVGQSQQLAQALANALLGL